MKVKITRYKISGKYYDSFEVNINDDIPTWDHDKVLTSALKANDTVKEDHYHYLIEVYEDDKWLNKFVVTDKFDEELIRNIVLKCFRQYHQDGKNNDRCPCDIDKGCEELYSILAKEHGKNNRRGAYIELVKEEDNQQKDDETDV